MLQRQLVGNGSAAPNLFCIRSENRSYAYTASERFLIGPGKNNNRLRATPDRFDYLLAGTTI